MEHKDKQIVELESEIRYLRQVLDENGIKYDYKHQKRTSKHGVTFFLPKLSQFQKKVLSLHRTANIVTI